jgi:hypothetical protein
MSTTFSRELERLRYWQGQTLRSRDYRDQARFDARRRQLHNRALHSTDGIAFGLAVTKIGANPLRLKVDCGVAYDCYGRELVLQLPREIDAPAEVSLLILRYGTASAGSSCCASPDPGCASDDAMMLDRDVELTWLAVASFERVAGVVLARSTGTDLDASFTMRQARPIARPRLARGETVRGNTPWEPWAIDVPDGQGGLTRTVVGVQTKIDTSAAGFTQVPTYLATVDAPAWDVAKAEFAPAFFPHVADPSVDGFTFRLLMVETTRRRYATAGGIARVEKTTRGLGDGLQIEVDDAAPFQKGDVVALLRPRARLVVRTKSGAGDTITLSAPLEEAEVDKTVLAIGNLPRTAKVINVTPESAAVLAGFQAAQAVKKGDVLLRTADEATAVIDSVSTAKKQLTVNHPFATWKAADAVSVARLSKAVNVDSAAVNGPTSKVELKPVNHGINKNFVVVFVDGSGDPVGGARTVAHHSGQTIEVTPPMTAAEIAAVEKVAVFTADITINDVTPKGSGMRVEVSSVASFAAGDFVADSGNTAAVTTVRKVLTSTKELELDATIPVAVNGTLIVANWLGAATVSAITAADPKIVTIGRTGAVPPGAFVVRRAPDDSLSPPAFVKAVSGATLTLDSAIADLARLDTLAISAFPHIVTVLSQQPDDETQIQILATQAGMLAPGDEVALVVVGATSAPIAQVATVAGNSVVLRNSLGALAAGQMLAVVNFTDRALLTKVNTPTSIEIDRDAELREGDVVGVLTHYADNSNPGWIDRIETGNRLVLAFPSVETGDGIADDGFIDGGVLGFASLVYAPTDPSPQWQYQVIVRLAATDGLEQFRPAVVYGLDLLTGRSVATAIFPFLYNGDRIVVFPAQANARYHYRPETLSLITTFNTDFPRAFATFAQKQQLSVSWIACQEEFPRPTGCPAQEPYDVCADAESTEA